MRMSIHGEEYMSWEEAHTCATKSGGWGAWGQPVGIRDPRPGQEPSTFLLEVTCVINLQYGISSYVPALRLRLSTLDSVLGNS